MDLASLRAFVFDLDGCVYTGRTLIPGVAEFLGRLRAANRRVLFLTNNSREDGAELQAKLERLGIAADRQEVLSAAEATGPFVRSRFGPVRLLAIGSSTLLRLLVEAGHTLVPLDAPRQAQVAVVGHDAEFTYQKLAALTAAIAHEATFVAVNVDPRLPIEGGYLPGCGALVEAVAAASGVRPEIVGKPRPTLFRAALERLAIPAGEAVMIGDSLLADIQGAQRIGLRTIWLAPPGAQPDVIRPDLVIRDFVELCERV